MRASTEDYKRYKVEITHKRPVNYGKPRPGKAGMVNSGWVKGMRVTDTVTGRSMDFMDATTKAAAISSLKYQVSKGR